MCRRMRSLWVSQSRSICIQYSVSSRSECMRTAQGSGQLCSTRSSAPRHSASLRRGGSLMPHQGLRCPPHRLCSSILIVLAYGLDKFSCDNGFCTERTVEFPSYCSDQICDQISAIRIQKTGKTLRTSYKNTKKGAIIFAIRLRSERSDFCSVATVLRPPRIFVRQIWNDVAADQTPI